jgi:hypothetical protein
LHIILDPLSGRGPPDFKNILSIEGDESGLLGAPWRQGAFPGRWILRRRGPSGVGHSEEDPKEEGNAEHQAEKSPSAVDPTM